MVDQDKVKDYAEKWLKIGLNPQTAPFTDAEKLEIEENLCEAYKIAGFPSPTQFFYEISPVAGYKKAVELADGETELHTCWGCHDADWFAVFDYYLNEENKQNLKQTIPMMNLGKLVGWFWTLDDGVVITERPSMIKVIEGNLHCDGGPVIAYRDGASFYALNGVRVSKEIAETPAHLLDCNLIFSETNAQVRAEIVKKIGYERIIDEIETDVIDTKVMKINHEPILPTGFFGKLFKRVRYRKKTVRYDLLMMDIGKLLDQQQTLKRPFLRMENPSVPGLVHIEGVGTPDFIPQTVEEALAWKLKLDVYSKPIQLT